MQGDSRPPKIVGNQQLPDLAETEVKFLLAYIGADPPHNGPRSAAKAWLCVNPTATPYSSHVAGKRMLSRLKSKGLLTLILDMQGLSIALGTETLRAGLRAEVVKRIDYPGGIWDYASVPDHRTRHAIARTLLELHNVLSPESSGDSSDAFRLSFAEAVAQEAEKRSTLHKQSLEAEDASFTEIKSTEGKRND